MRATDKRMLAALGVQAVAFALVGLIGGPAKLGRVPAPEPDPTPKVTITRTLTPAPVISTSFIRIHPAGRHHRPSGHRQSASHTTAANPTPDGSPDPTPVTTASSRGRP